MIEASRILVVDDDGIVVMMLQLKLREMGYVVAATASSGAEAIQLAMQLRPDLVLMDICLGGSMDGIEAARQIREAIGTPAVFLSTFSDDETLQRAKLSEPLGYIQKPVSDRELRVVVEIALYRIHTERALKLSEEKFRCVLETAIDAVVSIDSQGRITYFNAAAAKLFGYPPEEILGKEFKLLMHPQTNGMNSIELENFVASGGSAPVAGRMTVTGRGKDGSEFPVELSISSWKTLDGTFFTAIMRDITDRLVAEEGRRRNRELREINRAKDEFMAVVSHELRTPLTAMLGWTSLIRGGKLTLPEQRHAMSVIERNIHIQKKLVEDLLDVSRIISGKMVLNFTPIETQNLVASAMQTIQPAAAAKGVDLIQNFCLEKLAIQGDRDRLLQVVGNVLANSLKFTPAGGKIEVRIFRDTTEAVVTIADTGIGIEADFLPRIFERFRQEDASTTRIHQGLGLGLSIVHHLIDMHGGSVKAESPGKGQGATITLRLPVAQPRAQSEMKTREQLEVEIRPLENLLVLLVEDETDIREFLVSALCRYGAVVGAAQSAEEALTLFESFKPDVMVCDIGLPGEDGYALMSRIRERSPANGGKVPAIALTGFARAEGRRQALEAGYQAHFTKPPQLTELAASIAYLAGSSKL